MTFSSMKMKILSLVVDQPLSGSNCTVKWVYLVMSGSLVLILLWRYKIGFRKSSTPFDNVKKSIRGDDLLSSHDSFFSENMNPNPLHVPQDLLVRVYNLYVSPFRFKKWADACHLNFDNHFGGMYQFLSISTSSCCVCPKIRCWYIRIHDGS